MKTKVSLSFALLLGILFVVVLVVYPRKQALQPVASGPVTELVESTEAAPTVAAPEPPPAAKPEPSPAASEPLQTASPVGQPLSIANRAEHLANLRETFRTLAAGNPVLALRAARQITDDTEREAALLTLVTEWKQGQLSSPQNRAAAISALGLEAGLGLELGDQPDLATLWARELTDGRGRRAVLREAASTLLRSDPPAAFALGSELPENERNAFNYLVFAAWGGVDTRAAFAYANQLADPAERQAASTAIQSMAPVGIGAALGTRDGLTVINELIPGAPAALSGQVRPGDRIVAVAQGDNPFVDARGLPLDKVVQMIRGAPNSMLQLQLLGADAPPDATPRTVALLRDQINFKK